MTSTQIDSLIQERFRSDDAFLSDADLTAAIEALLMVAEGPVHPQDLAHAIGVVDEDVMEALHRLDETSNRGWIVQHHGDLVQLTTAPRFAGYVRNFLGIERHSRLSAAAVNRQCRRETSATSRMKSARGARPTVLTAPGLSRKVASALSRIHIWMNILR